MSSNTAESEKVRSVVRERYGAIARDFDGAASSCCAPSSSCCGDTEAEGQSNLKAVQLLYETPDVNELPVDVTGLSLGCGDPVTLASLQPGQTVLDLGSGGGIDCFLAAKRVGLGGQVIGVDMTADMIARARSNARKLGADNVEFRLGEIEHLPVADETVDVVISNCVINLSPDKPQVFRETFRVLRPGGRLAVSDIVTRVELPLDVRENLGAWAECVSGALVDRDYVAAITAAGFEDVKITEKQLEDAVIADGVDQLGNETDIDADTARSVIYSAAVTATKPRA
jgi:SAM-dependent methyltransferase